MAPKNRKKNVIGDDEYSMPDNEMDEVQLKNGMKEEPAGSVDAEPIQFTGKKKGKKGKKAVAAPDKDDENYSLEESEATVLHEASDNKKGKKGNKSVFSTLEEVFDDDVTTVAEEDDTDSIQFSGKKRGKKGKKAAAWSTDETESTGTAVDFNLNVEENYVEKDVGASLEQDGEDVIIFSGKKKGKKGKKSAGRSIGESESTDAAVDLDGNIGDADNDAENKMETAIVDEETDTIQFVGKKKSKKGKKNSTVADINDLENAGDGMDESTVNAQSFPSAEELEQTVEQDSTGSLEFSGKKKGKKGKKNVQVSDFDDIEAIMAELDRPKGAQKDQAPQEDAIDAVAVPNAGESEGKKKGKKGKKNDTGSEMDDIDSILAEFKAGSTPLEDMPTNVGSTQESSDLDALQLGGKKKNKKGKKVAAPTDADDIDSILAELEAPKPKSAPDASAKKEPESLLSGDTSAIAETTESAAAKKKKKKKEKTKADKPEETKEEKDEPPKAKTLDKKVPKHVREMQERLARMKEAEERLEREEEEKRRKEEEEQRRLEELERQKEEAKRRRKEREKEKLHQKKLEGKLLTGKQKEEARRLALMREQFLAQKGENDVLKEEVSGPRKPKYETKKKKKLPGADVNVKQADKGEVAIELEAEVEHEHEPEPEPQQELSESKMDVEEAETAEQEEEEEEEEEEDWDAKSWDDENVILPVIKSAFAEEEEEEDEEKGRSAVTVGKSTKRVVAEPVPPAKRSASPLSKTTKGGPSKSFKNEESGSEEESDDESEDDTKTKPLLESRQRREARKAEALSKRSADDLRSPICCILGHVDTGKTKLLDCIRRTNVQEGEAGGITQQIGATYFPMENIQERTKELLISKPELELRLPGLLVIDTPGHESFTNLRARGSGLCDIAILVIDIMHGLEPQTIESLNLLKMRHTPFVVALNKVDRLYGWKACPNAPIEVAFKQQNRDVMAEFKTRMTLIVTQLKEQGLNSEVYYNNKDSRKFINIVPTSAITGEGVPDLLILLVQLTQKRMEDKLMYISEVQCTVLEVKVVEGLGTTIDVILINGVLHEGDQIVVCGMQGAIVTTIRSLLTPHPMKELRVKGSYQHHKELKAAQGIKITAQGLEHAVAGTQLYVVGPDDDLEDIKKEAMQDMKNVMNRVDRSGEGVYVQASTLGSLEALLEFLKSVKIPVSGIGIGPVHKKDIVRASVMLEKKKEYATILAFDVKVTPEAKELAEETGVKIFMADIIYHLFDQFTAYMNNIKEEKRKDASEEAVFPCVLKIFPQYVFNKKDPIVLGVEVLEGILKIGTPICVPSRDNIDIGKIQSIEMNHKVVDVAKKGQEAAIKIVGTNPEESQKMYGRHFEHEDELVSHITRRSIDLLKENYRDDLTAEEWRLVVKLKKLFEIQ